MTSRQRETRKLSEVSLWKTTVRPPSYTLVIVVINAFKSTAVAAPSSFLIGKQTMAIKTRGDSGPVAVLCPALNQPTSFHS